MKNYTFDIENANTKDFFDKNGFALFRNVFSKEEIASIREQLLSIFKQKSDYEGDWDNRPPLTAIRTDLFNRYPQLRWVFYKPEIQNALKKVLGQDIGFVPESVAHYKGYGTWHKDTTSQESAGVMIQHAPDWMMVECAVYLQDNTDEYGGGLDVVPGTHRMKDEFLMKKSKNMLDRLFTKVNGKMVQNKKSKEGFRILSKAGDFLFFNKKLDHRASPHSVEVVPPEKEKLAIFFIGGVNNRHLKDYTNYIKTRKDYVYMKDYHLNEEFARESKERGINLITP